jgi:hypothetical protein
MRAKHSVSIAPQKSSDASVDVNASQDKAKIRRAQVRKAQIQHRQRKAEYTSKLEEDVTKYRELIAHAKHKSKLLSKENRVFREKLAQLNANPAASRATAWMEQQAQQPPLTEQPPVFLQTDPDTLRTQFEAQTLHDGMNDASEPLPELFGDIDIDDLTITLSMDDIMGTPCFNISSASPGASSLSTASSAGAEPGSQHLSYAQEQMAVNFILSLEHVCWDHFSEGHVNSVEPMLEGALGHTLMASAYCMEQAPDSVFTELDNISAQNQRLSPPTLQWSSQGISLSSLHGLARSLTNPDVEITPVQAWFDLASRFPTAVLLDPNMLASLKLEFKQIVHCVYYGAVMARDEYEAAIVNVFGTSSMIGKPVSG